MAAKKAKAVEPSVRVVLVTAPDEDVAAKLGRTLVEERLIVCANLIPKIRSIYRWEGAIHDEPEVLLVMKTQAASIEPLIARVKSLHPYQVPEVLEIPVERGFGKYLEWVVTETTPEPRVTRQLRFTPLSKLGALKAAVDTLGPGSEPIRIKVDLNEYQTGMRDGRAHRRRAHERDRGRGLGKWCCARRRARRSGLPTGCRSRPFARRCKMNCLLGAQHPTCPGRLLS